MITTLIAMYLALSGGAALVIGLILHRLGARREQIERTIPDACESDEGEQRRFGNEGP